MNTQFDAKTSAAASHDEVLAVGLSKAEIVKALVVGVIEGLT
jgi:hypothetical protein